MNLLKISNFKKIKNDEEEVLKEPKVSLFSLIHLKQFVIV